MKIIQVTDCHLLRDTDERFCNIYPDEHLKIILAAVQRQQPDMLWLTGDLSQDGTDEAYQRLAEYLKPIQCPIYFIAGNHDDAQILSENLTTDTVKRETLINLGDWQALFLDSTIPDKAEGYLKQDQFDLLDTHTANGKPTVVVMHHHPIQVNQFMDRYILTNYQAFQAAIATKPNVELVLFGHIHADFHQRIGHTDFYGCPATSIQISPVATSDDNYTDRQQPGFRVLTLSTGDLNAAIHQTQIIRVATTATSVQ